ncbi:hypothetical protein MEN41_23780, partial [Dolichospermum sp. ST_con]|nr:hypothetical protein [Dolichospermum sp. ST_con]
DITIDEFSNFPLEEPETPVNQSHQKITSLSELLGITSTPVQLDSSLSEPLNTTPKLINQPLQNPDLLSDLPSELGEALNAITSQIALKTLEIEEEIYPTPLPPLATNEAIAIELVTS